MFESIDSIVVDVHGGDLSRRGGGFAQGWCAVRMLTQVAEGC